MRIFYAALGGFCLDLLLGDPAWMPHPVVLMGRCITKLEDFLRKICPNELLGGADWSIQRCGLPWRRSGAGNVWLSRGWGTRRKTSAGR